MDSAKFDKRCKEISVPDLIQPKGNAPGLIQPKVAVPLPSFPWRDFHRRNLRYNLVLSTELPDKKSGNLTGQEAQLATSNQKW